MTASQELAQRVARLWQHLDERARRLFAASEARQLGRAGIAIVSRACGLSRPTITKGLRVLDEAPLPPDRVRRPGGGRLPLELRDPEVAERLDALVEPLSRGDPESPLRWTSKSTRRRGRRCTIFRPRRCRGRIPMASTTSEYSSPTDPTQA